jgi:hypothetical protein
MHSDLVAIPARHLHHEDDLTKERCWLAMAIYIPGCDLILGQVLVGAKKTWELDMCCLSFGVHLTA